MIRQNLLLFCFCFLSSFIFARTNYYVSPSGNNGNSGTSTAQPWQTIQHACNTATPGDNVYIMAGTYTETIWMNVSGTPSNWITFTNYQNDVVTIDGGSTGTFTELFVISGKAYIIIENLIFANATGNFSKGIFIGNGSDHIQILNNKFHDIHFSNNPSDPVTSTTNVNPLVVYNTNPTDACENILIQGNEIYDCRTGFSEALTLTGNVDGFEVLENIVRDITNIGIDIAGGYGVSSDPATDIARNGLVKQNTTYNCVSGYAVSAGIYIDGGQDIIVERNVSYQNGRGFEVGSEEPNHEAKNIIVRNNWSYNNLEAGIGIGGYDYPNTGKVTNSTISNNSFYNNNTTNIWDGELLVEYTENCNIENNIFYGNNTQNILIVTRLNSTNLNINYNNYYHSAGTTSMKVDFEGAVFTGFSNYQTGAGQDANSIFADPQYINPGAANFHISNGSPAINAGNPAFVAGVGETDFDGDMRIENSIVEIGADEIFVLALPVEYLSPLRATLQNEKVKLTWQTASEFNADRFEVERSNDGNQWEQIAIVPAQNRSNFYVFEDLDLDLDRIYYRLRQVDHDEQFYFSNIESVEIPAASEIKVFPNPSDGKLFIQTKNEIERLQIFNTNGELVHEDFFPEKNELFLKNIKTGIFTVRIFSKNNWTTQRILIAR